MTPYQWQKGDFIPPFMRIFQRRLPSTRENNIPQCEDDDIDPISRENTLFMSDRSVKPMLFWSTYVCGHYFQSCDPLRICRSSLLMNEIASILFHIGP
jgi:hypothetical protein